MRRDGTGPSPLAAFTTHDGLGLLPLVDHVGVRFVSIDHILLGLMLQASWRFRGDWHSLDEFDF